MANERESKPVKTGKPAALTDWAYTNIKEDILNLRVQPGHQLHIEKLSEELGISRTPIREALLRLETAGLVQVLPRVGFFVADITTNDIAELFEVREWLESNAAAKAVSTLTDDDLAGLDELMANTARAIEQGDSGKFLEFEEAFHNLIIQRCGNKHLLGVMESLYNLTRRERVLSIRSKENISWSLVEHQQVVAAFHARNALQASAMMVAHIRAASARLCNSLAMKREDAEKGV